MLRIGEERVARELIWVPKRKITILNAFDPEKSRGDKIGTEVSFREEVSPIKQVIEKKEGAKKKGKTGQKIGRFYPFYFRPDGGYHKGLILTLTTFLLLPIWSRKCWGPPV